MEGVPRRQDRVEGLQRDAGAVATELPDDIALERLVARRAGKTGPDVALALEVNEGRVALEAGGGAPFASEARGYREDEQKDGSGGRARDLGTS